MLILYTNTKEEKFKFFSDFYFFWKVGNGKEDGRMVEMQEEENRICGEWFKALCYTKIFPVAMCCNLENPLKKKSNQMSRKDYKKKRKTGEKCDQFFLYCCYGNLLPHRYFEHQIIIHKVTMKPKLHRDFY